MSVVMMESLLKWSATPLRWGLVLSTTWKMSRMNLREYWYRKWTCKWRCASE